MESYVDSWDDSTFIRKYGSGDVYDSGSLTKNVSKDDVISYLKKHPELLDDIIVMMRNEKIKKLRK